MHQPSCAVHAIGRAVEGPHGLDDSMDLSIAMACWRRYLSWDDYFIALAFLSSQRSKDPNKQVLAWPCHTIN